MAKLGKKYFTKGKVMIGIFAEGYNRPMMPFDPRVDNVDYMELVKKCEGINLRQAEELYKELTNYFLNKPAKAWVDLPTFVDLAPTKKLRILTESV